MTERAKGWAQRVEKKEILRSQNGRKQQTHSEKRKWIDKLEPFRDSLFLRTGNGPIQKLEWKKSQRNGHIHTHTKRESTWSHVAKVRQGRMPDIKSSEQEGPRRDSDPPEALGCRELDSEALPAPQESERKVIWRKVIGRVRSAKVGWERRKRAGLARDCQCGIHESPRSSGWPGACGRVNLSHSQQMCCVFTGNKVNRWDIDFSNVFSLK